MRNIINQSKKLRLFGTIFPYLMLLMFVQPACNKMNDLEGARKKQAAVPELEIVDYESYGYKEGRRNWRLRAEKTEVYSAQKKTIFYKFNLINYRENGHFLNQISADRGVRNDENENIHLKGNVHAENDEGTKLLSESLYYNKQKELVTSKDEVTIIRPNGDKLIGKGLRADVGLKKIELLSNVRGIRNPQ